MLRLIWAELKKVFLNIRFVIAIFSTIIVFIILFTLIYSSMMRFGTDYRDDIYYPSPLPGTDLGPEYVQSVLDSFDYSLAELDTVIAGLEDIKNANAKTVLKSQYDQLRAQGAKITQYFDPDVLSEYDADQIWNTNIFGPDNKLLPKYAELLDGVSEKSQYLSQLEQYIDETAAMITALDPLENTFLLFPDDLRNTVFETKVELLEHLHQKSEDADIEFVASMYAEYLALLESNPDSAIMRQNNIKFVLSSAISFYKGLSTAKNEGSLVPFAAIDRMADAINQAITFNLSEKDYNYLYDFVNTRSISVKSRLGEIYDRVNEYLSVAALSKAQIKEIDKESNRFKNLYLASKDYVYYYVVYQSVKEQGLNIDKFYQQLFVTLYDIKTLLTAMPYILDNGLYVETVSGGIVKVEGYSVPYGSFTSIVIGDFYSRGDDYKNIYNFISFIFATLSIVIITTCVIIGGGQIAGEQKSGTIKMLIIRPYRRWKILTAKILSTLIIAMILILASLLLTIIAGLILGLHFTTAPIFCVFNGSSVIIMHPVVDLIIKTLSLFFTLVIYILVSTMFSTVMKSRTAAVIVALLLNLLGGLFVLVFAEFISVELLLFANTDLYAYFSYGPVEGAMTFWFSLIVCLIYAAIFAAIAFLAFLKRDLN